MGLTSLFARQPVLTHEELESYLRSGSPSGSSRTVDSLLSYHVRQGHLVRVRRGLYLTLPPGAEPDMCPCDPFLIAAKSAGDSVLAYHTALELFGRAHSTFQHVFFLTARSIRRFRFRSFTFRAVKFPKSLTAKGMQNFGVKQVERSGLTVSVASLERTLVDVLDRPDLGGGWEEIWRSLESVEFFDLDQVVEYALLLNNSTTVAKVGFFLEQHREALMVGDEYLSVLKKHRPRQPHYLERSKSGRFVANWNLVVPTDLLQRSWSEVP